VGLPGSLLHPPTHPPKAPPPRAQPHQHKGVPPPSKHPHPPACCLHHLCPAVWYCCRLQRHVNMMRQHSTRLAVTTWGNTAQQQQKEGDGDADRQSRGGVRTSDNSTGAVAP